MRPLALIVALIGFALANLNGNDCGTEGAGCASGSGCCSTGYWYCTDEGVNAIINCAGEGANCNIVAGNPTCVEP